MVIWRLGLPAEILGRVLRDAQDDGKNGDKNKDEDGTMKVKVKGKVK